jgi:hypothetical protein
MTSSKQRIWRGVEGSGRRLFWANIMAGRKEKFQNVNITEVWDEKRNRNLLNTKYECETHSTQLTELKLSLELEQRHLTMTEPVSQWNAT